MISTPTARCGKGANTVYIKAGDHIEDLLTFMGAGNAAMR